VVGNYDPVDPLAPAGFEQFFRLEQTVFGMDGMAVKFQPIHL
jgi:hypothetical protein